MNLSMSMSKFYIKNNMVINHPSDINKKKDIQNHLVKFFIINIRSYNFSNIINNELNKFVEKERKLISIRSQREKPN